jgi:transcriptional regulator with XRE-family HTH domain
MQAQAALADLRRWRRKVGEAIRARRIERDVSLHSLARDVHIRPERLDSFERGRDEIRPEHIVRLAAALEAEFETLFFGSADFSLSPVGRGPG